MTWIAPAGIGSLVVDSFEFRCAPKDTFFLMVRSESSHTLAFHYYLSWTFIPASLPVDTEPNDLPAQAAPWPEDSVMGGHLYRTCVWLDEDIYRIVLPYSPDQITFLAHVENGSDAPGQMSVAVLDGSGATLASGTLTAGPFGAPLQDTLSLALPFADTIYVQMSESSSCGIAYALHYELGTDTLFAGNPESPTTHDDGLIVLPNPVSGTAQFNAPIHGSGKAEVMIFDASSALLAHFDRSISHNACSGELDMTAYPAGVYVVRISTLEQSFATRFVVIP